VYEYYFTLGVLKWNFKNSKIWSWRIYYYFSINVNLSKIIMSEQDVSAAHVHPKYVVCLLSLCIWGETSSIYGWGSPNLLNYSLVFIYLFTSEVKSLHLSS